MKPVPNEPKSYEPTARPFAECEGIVEKGLKNVIEETKGFKAGYRDRIAYHEFSGLEAWETFDYHAEQFKDLLERFNKFPEADRIECDRITHRLAAGIKTPENEIAKIGNILNIYQAIVTNDTQIKNSLKKYEFHLKMAKKFKDMQKQAGLTD